MNQIRFALVVHNHQPFGNSDKIIETNYRTSYLPFIKTLAAHPEIRANLHYTGFLLEWIEKNHPEFIDLLRNMIELGQIEIVGGAYYEPVVAVIPDSDAIGQIEKLTRKIESLFDQSPRGFWLAERAWEPHLPEILSRVKARYTFIDDSIFQSSGLDASECFEPYLVESRGAYLTVFPILKQLRFAIPFKPVSTTIAYLSRAAKEGHDIALLGDDGEKFGAWPTTYELVYRKGWLEQFFRSLSSRKFISTVKLSDYLKSNIPKRRIYLPSGAYPEMMDWSIPYKPKQNPSEAKQKRGFWRLFFAKYPESARIYSKMLYASKLSDSVPRKQKEYETIKDELWKGQCNDAYWHGIFGGLYAPNLRRTTYAPLIESQVLSEGQLHKNSNWISLETRPVENEGEHWINTKRLGVAISTVHGGSISELSFKPRYVNMIDTLARHPEKYHEQLRKMTSAELKKRTTKKMRSIHEAQPLKEKGLRNLLAYDKYPKFAFMDYLVTPNTSYTSFIEQNYVELASFAGQVYTERKLKKSPNSITTSLSRNSASNNNGNVRIEKEYTIPSDSSHLDVDYSISIARESKINFIQAQFIPEISLGCFSDRTFSRNFRRPLIQSSDVLKLDYPETGVRATLTTKNSEPLWVIPIKTVSMSESGFESNVQGVSILPNFVIELRKREVFRTHLNLALKAI